VSYNFHCQLPTKARKPGTMGHQARRVPPTAKRLTEVEIALSAHRRMSGFLRVRGRCAAKGELSAAPGRMIFETESEGAALDLFANLEAVKALVAIKVADDGDDPHNDRDAS
jgi:hypothetical protein